MNADRQVRMLAASALAAVMWSGGALARIDDGIMLVFLHGSAGPLSAQSVEMLQSSFDTYAPVPVVVVAPRIDYEVRHIRNPSHEARRNHRDAMRVVDVAREKHGDLPTVWVGASRGGYAAIYAAQRDELAIWSAAVFPCMLGSLNRDAYANSFSNRLRTRSHKVLARRATDNTPGVWLAGGRDEVCAPHHVRAMHDRAGAGMDLIEMPMATHRDLPRWWIPMYEFIRSMQADHDARKGR